MTLLKIEHSYRTLGLIAKCSNGYLALAAVLAVSTCMFVLLYMALMPILVLPYITPNPSPTVPLTLVLLYP